MKHQNIKGYIFLMRYFFNLLRICHLLENQTTKNLLKVKNNRLTQTAVFLNIFQVDLVLFLKCWFFLQSLSWQRISKDFSQNPLNNYHTYTEKLKIFIRIFLCVIIVVFFFKVHLILWLGQLRKSSALISFISSKSTGK